MHITIGNILGLLVALAYVATIIATQGGITESAFKGCVVLLLPLALIWFPDELGSFTGYVGRGGNINTPTPPILVSTMGWMLLARLIHEQGKSRAKCRCAVLFMNNPG